MKRVKRKIKELMSRPSKNLKKMTSSLVRQKPNFSLEEEAAQIAYRRGWDIPINQSYLVSSPVGSDIEEEITPEPSEDKEIIVRERDPLIERLEKKVSMSEKDGWEAIYT